MVTQLVSSSLLILSNKDDLPVFSYFSTSDIKEFSDSTDSLLTSNITSPSCIFISSASIFVTIPPTESVLSLMVIPNDLIIFS